MLLMLEDKTEKRRPGAFAEATSTGPFTMVFVLRRAAAEREGGRFRWGCFRISSGAARRRKPRLLLALPGSLRFDAVPLSPWLFHLSRIASAPYAGKRAADGSHSFCYLTVGPVGERLH